MSGCVAIWFSHRIKLVTSVVLEWRKGDREALPRVTQALEICMVHSNISASNGAITGALIAYIAYSLLQAFADYV